MNKPTPAAVTHFMVRRVYEESRSGIFDYWEKITFDAMTDAQAIAASEDISWHNDALSHVETWSVYSKRACPPWAELALFSSDQFGVLVFRASDGRLIHDTSDPITFYTYAKHCIQAGSVARNVGASSHLDDPTDDHVEHVGTRAELIEQARHDLARDYTDRTGRFERQTARAILAHLDAGE